jgi:hypothetical protein
MPHILLILFFILTAIIADDDSLIIEADNKVIESILQEERDIGIVRDMRIEDKKLTAVLSIISTILLQGNTAPVANEKSDFSQVIVESFGTSKKYLSGKVTDKEGVGKLVASFDDGSPDKEYTVGIVTGKSLHDKGTTVVLTATDDKGDVTTETRVM